MCRQALGRKIGSHRSTKWVDVFPPRPGGVVGFHLRALAFDLSLKADDAAYSVQGVTEQRVGLSTELDFAPVKIVKSTPSGENDHFDNEGTLTVHSRVRGAQGALAGVNVAGEFLKGGFDAGIFFDGLSVGDQPSTGALDYKRRNHTFNALEGTTFGDQKIEGIDVPAIDVNGVYGPDAISVAMRFGPFDVTGNIGLGDTCERVETDVFKCRLADAVAAVDLTVAKPSGEAIDLSDGSTDEASLRKLLAFMQLTISDIIPQ